MPELAGPAKSEEPDAKVRSGARTAGQGPEAAPHSMHRIQSALGNRGLVSLLGAQPKLRVGAAADHYELEADRVASEVVSRIRSGSAPVDQAAEPDAPVAQRISRLATTGAPNGSAAGPVGPEGGEVAGGTESAVNRLRGGGRGLPTGARTKMESAFGADFGSVRLHEGAESASLNDAMGAAAFTIGNDVFLGRSTPHLESAAGQRLLAHELTHTIQQGGFGRVSQRSVGTIQRHASWEHKMLGDVDPKELEIIASGRDLVAEKKKAALENRPEKTLTTEDGRTIDPDTVLHAIQQEIERLQKFAKNPPTSASTETQDRLNKEDQDKQDLANDFRELLDEEPRPDQKYDVRLVSIALRDGSKAILTYGEVNTLADFYGSSEQLRQTDPQQFRNYVYGIREESIRKFMRLHNEVAQGLGRETEYDPDSDENKVQDDTATSMGNTGAQAPTGLGVVLNSDDYGELKMMGKLGTSEKRAEIGGKEETSYTAGLGRNACHFAPQSWHAWADQHNKAISLALQAFELRKSVDAEEAQLRLTNSAPDKTTAQRWEINRQKADDLQNQALLENAFGDHFLQDSYAAGHLINKTLIMQWFVKWLDDNWNKRTYSSDEDWRGIQNVAYGQEGVAGRDLYSKEIGTGPANDAQSVENMTDKSWQERFTALGLKIQPSIANPKSLSAKLFKWWQDQAAKDDDAVELELGDFLKVFGKGNQPGIENALKALLNDGVVYYGNYQVSDRAKGAEKIGLSGFFGDKPLKLKSEYVPSASSWTSMKRKEDRTGKDTEYQDKLKSTAYGDYHKFLNHGYLQLATNILHNYFCLNGLWVNNEAGKIGYKIYGDNSMLQTESAKMVKESSTTSHMSRDSIMDLAKTGATGNTTKAIADRIPKNVSTTSDGKTVSLENWHGENGGLKKFCWDDVFPNQVAPVFSKSTVVASDKLAGRISQDVGAGEAF